MKRIEGMPGWAYYGLLGTNTREAAVQLLWLMLVFGVVAVLGGIVSGKYYLIVALLPAVWQWASVKWADKNSFWKDESQ